MLNFCKENSDYFRVSGGKIMLLRNQENSLKNIDKRWKIIQQVKEQKLKASTSNHSNTANNNNNNNNANNSNNNNNANNNNNNNNDNNNNELKKAAMNEMTDDEIIMLQSTSFKDIWDYLWINNNKDYKSDYIMALKKYQTLDIGEFVKNKNLFYDSPEWGFPKGRRNFKEKDIECAIRECCEET